MSVLRLSVPFKRTGGGSILFLIAPPCRFGSGSVGPLLGGNWECDVVIRFRKNLPFIFVESRGRRGVREQRNG